MNLDVFLRTSRIFFIAMIMAVVVYAVLATVTAVITTEPAPQPELARQPFAQPLVLVMIVVAIVIFAMAVFARSKLMPPRHRGPGSGDGPKDPKAALGRLRSAEIVTWMLCDAIAACGLVLSMLSFEPLFTYAFGGPAILALLLFAPSRKLAEEVVWAAASE